MAIPLVRLAVMARVGDLADVTVPADPLPMQLTDKTIVVYPRPGQAVAAAQSGRNGSLPITARDVLIVEYHRVIPEKTFASVIADVTTMLETLRTLAWGEFKAHGGKFGSTVQQLHAVTTLQFGELGWNEFTFGVRIGLDLTHSSVVS